MHDLFRGHLYFPAAVSPAGHLFTCYRSKDFQSAPQSFSVYACNLILSAFSNPVISPLIAVVPDTVITVKACTIGFSGAMVKAVYVICAMVANTTTAWHCILALVYLFRDQPKFFKRYLVIHTFLCSSASKQAFQPVRIILFSTFSYPCSRSGIFSGNSRSGHRSCRFCVNVLCDNFEAPLFSTFMSWHFLIP